MDRNSAEPACDGFKWIGQSFASCDDCGQPYWDHEFDSFREVRITPAEAAKCRERWERR
jgi:hypothetical protein